MQITDENGNQGPLKGVKVLEFSSMVAGPLCGQVLGDLGADVIKVEGLGGDTARYLGPPFREGLSGFYAQNNRNKRSIAIDLKSEEGRQVVLDLVADMDVVMENFRHGVLDRLGIGYEALKAINPGLVYVAITGFGSSGPYADYPAYDLLIQGMSGAMPVQGTPEDPQMVQGIIVDKTVGFTAASCTLAALYARATNGGIGQRVDVPMLDAYGQLTLSELAVPHAFQPKEEFESLMPDLYRKFATRDGFVVGILLEDKHFQALAQALDCEALVADERFGSPADRIGNYDVFCTELEKVFANWDSETLIEIARASGAPFAPVYSVEDVFADPQVQHNRTVFTATDPQGGEALYVRHAGHYEKTPASLRLHPPRLGEHTDEILKQLGYSADQINAMKEGRAVG